MPRTPTPRLISVQYEDAGYYSMTLCWESQPARRLTVRLQTPVTSLADAKAAAADELLRFDAPVLEWLYRHAGPGARCDEPPDRTAAAPEASPA